MGFHDHAVFPEPIAFGTAGGPSWDTRVVTTAAGFSTRSSARSLPIWRYSVSLDGLAQADIATLMRFAILRQGSLYGFRFKDRFDFVSTLAGTLQEGEAMPAGPASTQLIGVGDGNQLQFQIIKTYTDGTTSKVRTITRPINNGTLLIALNTTAKTEGVDFTVDYATGVVTFTTAPSVGVNVWADYQFHVPVWFGPEVDEWLAGRMVAHNNASTSPITLIGGYDVDAEEDPSNPAFLEQPEEFAFRGATTLGSISANTQINLHQGAMIRVTPSTGGLRILLPDVSSNLVRGGPVVTIANDSGTNTITARDEYDSTGPRNVKTIATSSVATFWVGMRSDGSHIWYGTS